MVVKQPHDGTSVMLVMDDPDETQRFKMTMAPVQFCPEAHDVTERTNQTRLPYLCDNSGNGCSVAGVGGGPGQGCQHLLVSADGLKWRAAINKTGPCPPACSCISTITIAIAVAVWIVLVCFKLKAKVARNSACMSMCSIETWQDRAGIGALASTTPCAESTPGASVHSASLRAQRQVAGGEGLLRRTALELPRTGTIALRGNANRWAMPARLEGCVLGSELIRSIHRSALQTTDTKARSRLAAGASADRTWTRRRWWHRSTTSMLLRTSRC